MFDGVWRGTDSQVTAVNCMGENKEEPTEAATALEGRVTKPPASSECTANLSTLFQSPSALSDLFSYTARRPRN